MARNKESSYEPTQGRFPMDDALTSNTNSGTDEKAPARSSNPKTSQGTGRTAPTSSRMTKSSERKAPVAAAVAPKQKQKSRGVTKSVYFKEPVLQYLESFGDDFVFSDLVNQIIAAYAAEHSGK